MCLRYTFRLEVMSMRKFRFAYPGQVKSESETATRVGLIEKYSQVPDKDSRDHDVTEGLGSEPYNDSSLPKL